MQLKSVVLPAPFGPIRPTMLPGATSNDTPSSATMPPKRTATSCTRSSACPASAVKGTSSSGNSTELEFAAPPELHPPMTEVAAYAVRDGVAVITMNNPPVNGLGNALRAGILQALQRADADPEVKAAVLI